MKQGVSQLKVTKNARFPDNTIGLVTPADVRNQEEDNDDSFINEVDLVGSGLNASVSGGKNFPEVHTDGAFITWDLQGRIDGFSILSSATAAIGLTLNNFRAGTERILRVKKTISGDITITLSSGDSIPFFDFYGNAVSGTIILSGATNSYFIIHFRNYVDQIFWHMETQ